MEKNKMFYITLVLVVCVVFTGIGCFYLGTKFGENSSNVGKKKVLTIKDLIMIIKKMILHILRNY